MTTKAKVHDWQNSHGKKWSNKIDDIEKMLEPFNEPIIQALELEKPTRIADIGCGGGRTALAIARLAPAGSTVDGYDISQDLINIGQKRIPATGDTKVTFSCADMQREPAPKIKYDRLASRFGIMFFENPREAFANLYGWLRVSDSGEIGKFVFSAWASPEKNPWMVSVHKTVAKYVDMPPNEEDAPGPFRYADKDKLLKLLKEAGFTNCDTTQWQHKMILGSGFDSAGAADFALSSFSTFQEMLEEAGAGAYDRAKEDLISYFQDHEVDGIVKMDANVHIFKGTTS